MDVAPVPITLRGYVPAFDDRDADRVDGIWGGRPAYFGAFDEVDFDDIWGGNLRRVIY